MIATAAWRCLLITGVACALTVSVTDFGAVGDNKTDCTVAFRAALAAVRAAGGGEVVVPAPGLYKTLPVNLSVRRCGVTAVCGLADASVC